LELQPYNTKAKDNLNLVFEKKKENKKKEEENNK
jgi:hypothetical protein